LFYKFNKFNIVLDVITTSKMHVGIFCLNKINTKIKLIFKFVDKNINLD